MNKGAAASKPPTPSLANRIPKLSSGTKKTPAARPKPAVASINLSLGGLNAHGDEQKHTKPSLA